MKQTIAIILCTLCFAHVSGQTYRGKVCDKSGGKPIESVTVCLLKSDSLTLAFTSSSSNGDFELAVPKGHRAEYLSFSILGYKKRIIPLADYKNGEKTTLESAVFNIREVKVTAQRIREQEDTLIYSVSGFSMPQDRSIADVIKKMPGLEVKPSGVITYNGNTINKFYIEGMDLLGSRYAMASNNLSNKKVKQVQVLRNHQAVNTLRNKVCSNQAALNLILTEDAKTQLVGTADVGTGSTLTKNPDLLYNCRLLAMMFGSKQQNLTMYKNDNTGKDILREVSPLTRQDAIKGGFADIEKDIISPIGIQVPNLDRSRYIFNQSHLVATNHLVRTKHKTDIRAQVSYLYDKSDLRNSMETLYMLYGDEKLVSEQSSLTEKMNEVNVTLNVEANKDSYYINSRTEAVLEFCQSNGSTLLNGVNTSIWAKPDRRYFVEDFDFVRPLKNGKIFSISSINTYNYLPQQLLIYSGNTESVTMNSFGSHTFTYFQHKAGRIYVKYQAGLKIHDQSMSLLPDVNHYPKSNSSFTLYQPYLEPSVSYKNYAVDVKAGIRLSYANAGFDGRNGMREHKQLFMPEPSLNVDYKINGYCSVSGSYNYYYRLSDLRDLNRNLIFTSYRTATVSDLDFYKNTSHLARVNLKYSHPVKGTFFSAGASYSPTRKTP